jgi:tetratricopeptide (TPR) repeat protein
MEKNRVIQSISALGITASLTFFAAGCASIERRMEANEIDAGAAKLQSPKAASGGGAQGGPDAKTLAQAKKNTAEAQRNTEATAEYHFSLAQAYVAEGNPDRAIEEYKLTLMFDPNSALVYARLATEYVKKGMLSAAMETCKEALQRDPKFIDARLMLAGLYSTSRETELALNEYNRVLRQDPTHEEAMVYKAQVLVEDERPTQAAKELSAFLKRVPESALVWYYLGRAEQRQNHFKEAVLAYRKSMDLRPSFTQAGLALGYLYEEQKMNAQALRVYRGLYDESEDAAAANRLATIYLKEEKYVEAVPYLEALESADPDDMNVRVKLGLVHMELKNYDRAISIFQGILAKNPESDRIHYYLGSLFEETGKMSAAIEHLKKIAPDSKLFADAALHVAYLLKQDKKGDEARTHIEESIAKSPRVANFYMFLASMEEEDKNFAEAAKVLDKALAFFPEDEKVRYYLGSIYDRMGDTDKSLEQMERILSINPKNVDALNYIGYTWTSKGIRLNDAEKLLRRALALRPDNGYIQDSWGWYLFVRGRVNEAVVELEKAVRLKPNETTILEHLGDAYARSNLREKALQQYQEAVRYADDDDSRRKLEGKLQNLTRELVRSGRIAPSGAADAERVPAGKISPRAEE